MSHDVLVCDVCGQPVQPGQPLKKISTGPLKVVHVSQDHCKKAGV